MKRKILALSLTLSLVIGLSSCNWDSGNEPVQTATGILPIKEVTSQTEEILTESETENFGTDLDSEDYITICGRQYSKDLTEAVVYVDSGTDLGDLKHLDKIQNLTISSTNETGSSINVSGVDSLKDLTNLTSLSISVDLEDFQQLSNLKNLEQISFYYCSLSDITFMENMTELKEITLDHTFVSDLSPIKELNNIQNLYLDNCVGLDDLSVLEHFIKMKSLFFIQYYSGNKVELDFLKNLTQLLQVYIEGNYDKSMALSIKEEIIKNNPECIVKII